MKLGDFATLQDARPYKLRTLKNTDERMLNERGIFSLIGLQAGETLMQAIEASAGIPARVKAWFKPSEQGIDISDPNALGILAGMVAANVLTQANSDILTEYAYVTTQPFINATKNDFELEKGIFNKIPIVVKRGLCRIRTTADTEKHNPQIYQRIDHGNNDIEYKRVAGFRDIEKAGYYPSIECPNGDMYIDDAYSVIQQG
jgi:hypothetical protein